jgi:hypothetical protein
MHQVSTAPCGNIVLYDMCCLGGCGGLCAWSNACMWGWLREECMGIVLSGVWQHWKNIYSLSLLFEPPCSIQASHCMHLLKLHNTFTFGPALNCLKVSFHYSGSRPEYSDPLAARDIGPQAVIPLPPPTRQGWPKWQPPCLGHLSFPELTVTNLG